MAIIERRLQGCLDKLMTCADENGFKFSPTKTLCVHFCKKNGLQPEPDLKLYGQQLPVEEQIQRFLQMYLTCLHVKHHGNLEIHIAFEQQSSHT